jgi:hypothetical protein
MNSKPDFQLYYQFISSNIFSSTSTITPIIKVNNTELAFTLLLFFIFFNFDIPKDKLSKPHFQLFFKLKGPR